MVVDAAGDASMIDGRPQRTALIEYANSSGACTMPTLYIVATPIGNLEDVTMRALSVLREVDLIAAEDTRITRRLLARYEIETPLTSYHEHSASRKTSALLDALRIGKDLALVSDAGMPAVNDPGAELVAAAAAAGFEVTVVPGASALTAALALSGLVLDGFVYLGFLPRRRKDRIALLESMAADTRPLLALETPHRLQAALADLQAALGDRPVVVAREMTKLHEEVFRGTLSAAIGHFQSPRGEFTLVIEGATEQPPRPDGRDEAARLLARLRQGGMRGRAAVDLVADQTGLPRRQVYRMWVETAPPDTGQRSRGLSAE